MIHFKDGSNILDVKDGVICQQVNCMGVMGAGLAKQIALRYPDVKAAYMRSYRGCAVGNVSYVDIDDYLTVANMFAQHNYGRTHRHTNYEGFYNCLEDIATNCINRDIHIPYNIGCGLGGADWSIIESMIKTVLLRTHEIYIHRL